MRRKRLAAGEIRFRVSKDDLKRIDYLMTYMDEYQSISQLIRSLIGDEYKRRNENDGTTQKGR